ncbi:hypothetical protein pb186bvf_001301 [Paramecium bursaria]
MSDFQYDRKDVVTLNTFYQQLLIDERRGFYYGFFGGLAVNILLKRYTALTGKSILSLIAGGQIYGAYTHQARKEYEGCQLNKSMIA